MVRHHLVDEAPARAEKKLPQSLTPRLALELLIGTALSRSDVVHLGRQPLRDGGAAIFVSHKKTGWSGTVPVTPESL